MQPGSLAPVGGAVEGALTPVGGTVAGVVDPGWALGMSGLFGMAGINAPGLQVRGRRFGKRRSLGLPAGSELVVFVFEQDVEGRERSVAARDVLMQIELVGVAQFVAGVHLLFEHAKVVPDHNDLVKKCFERHFLRLQRGVGGLHDQISSLPAGRQTLYDGIFWFEAQRFNHGMRGIAN